MWTEVKICRRLKVKRFDSPSRLAKLLFKSINMSLDGYTWRDHMVCINVKLGWHEVEDRLTWMGSRASVDVKLILYEREARYVWTWSWVCLNMKLELCEFEAEFAWTGSGVVWMDEKPGSRHPVAMFEQMEGQDLVNGKHVQEVELDTSCKTM